LFAPKGAGTKQGCGKRPSEGQEFKKPSLGGFCHADYGQLNGTNKFVPLQSEPVGEFFGSL
jgi:hypothetical protein